MRDEIALTGLRVDCIVGIYPGERTTPQPVDVEARLELDLSRAAASAAVGATIDYAELAAELTFILQAGRFQLLESAAMALVAHMLHGPRGHEAPRVERGSVALAKPAILTAFAHAGAPPCPTVRIARDRAAVPAPRSIRLGDAEALEVFACPDAVVAYAPRPLAGEARALAAGGYLLVLAGEPSC
jgi:dihydroneopterin aldolase